MICIFIFFIKMSYLKQKDWVSQWNSLVSNLLRQVYFIYVSVNIDSQSVKDGQAGIIWHS